MNKIIKTLKQKKSIPLDKFINLALYDKNFGYYSKKNPFGKNGDYTTSPLISILFGEMIALWCIAFWEHLRKPKKFLLIDIIQIFNNMSTSNVCFQENFILFRNITIQILVLWLEIDNHTNKQSLR